MWINLTDEELRLVKEQLRAACRDDGEKNAAETLLDRIDELETAGPHDAEYISAMEERYGTHPWTDGDVDFDSEPMVSSGDGGAYVMAWFWVSDEIAGIEDEDENLCRTCGEEYDEGGDGYDGECPDCADKTDQKLHPGNYE